MYCWTINFWLLHPIKRKQISEKVANRLNLSVETVDEIVSCYYNTVQKQLSNLEHSNIRIENLGTFFIKRSNLEKKLLIYEKALAKFEAIKRPSLSEFKSIKELRDDVKKFKNALENLDEIDAKKLEKKELKKIYKSKRDESN
jgi:nucleoid DNA-binding protein